MKRFTTIFFILTAIAIGIFAIYTYKQPKESEHQTISAKIIKPSAQKITSETEDTVIEETEAELQTSLIELMPGETLINAISIDMDNDTFDDQIISIRKAGSNSIYLITGIYNPKKKIYERKSEINTEISKSDTFSFSVQDMTGDHRNSLTYTGLNNKEETILKVLLPEIKGNDFKYNAIADFTADASIFIQQIQRSDPYYFSQVQGESFPIWVYSSDTSKSKDSLDQIQSMYNWNPLSQKYTKVSENRVAGKKIAAEELQKIQDGTTQTFEKFLDGLWFKSSAGDSSIRYVFFDPEKHEIIFSANTTQSPDTTQEIYQWNATSLHRGGAKLTMVNTSVTSLVRRFDISLNGIDEIKVKVNDDVKMAITQETLWDGTYKKISVQSMSAQQADFDSSILKQIETTSHIWTTNTNMSITIKNGQYAITSESWAANGAVTSLRIKNTTLLQFKSFTDEKYLHGYYLPAFTTTKNGTDIRETLILTPVAITTDGFTNTTAPTIKLERLLTLEN